MRSAGALLLVALTTPLVAAELPDGVVYLRDVAPSVVQDIRYATSHNFVGRPIDGYEAGECILSAAAAERLAGLQERLVAGGFTLIVWDCYRPARAVADFKAWSADPADQSMKAEFYPNEEKAKFFERGYLASRSRHSTGSTVDLGIAALAEAGKALVPADDLVSCLAPYGDRYDDHALDFGTGYDCLDPASGDDADAISTEARNKRDTLRKLMMESGFKPYGKQWWHFELVDAPFAGQHFDFPIAPWT